MANANLPRGFVPSRYADGTTWNGAANKYYIPSTDTNQYNPGDVVKSFAGADAFGVPAVTKITNGTDTPRGVIMAVVVSPENNISLVGTNLDLTLQNIPATKTKGYYVWVVDDPAVLFELQDDGLNVLTGTAVNKNASFTVANPTSPQQNSATVLNTASVATTSTLNLRLQGLVQRDDNAFGQYAKWLVRFNQHELIGNTAGV